MFFVGSYLSNRVTYMQKSMCWCNGKDLPDLRLCVAFIHPWYQLSDSPHVCGLRGPARLPAVSREPTAADITGRDFFFFFFSRFISTSKSIKCYKCRWVPMLCWRNSRNCETPPCITSLTIIALMQRRHFQKQEAENANVNFGRHHYYG